MSKYVIWDGRLIIFRWRERLFVGHISIWRLKWFFSRSITILLIIGLLGYYSINFFMDLLLFPLKVYKKWRIKSNLDIINLVPTLPKISRILSYKYCSLILSSDLLLAKSPIILGWKKWERKSGAKLVKFRINSREKCLIELKSKDRKGHKAKNTKDSILSWISNN